jgi:tetratricopeptide (TPR) repeat protein
MREIEFEFDEGGSGEFRPSGNVVKVIGDYLAKGEVERAASLLAASGPEVGDRLIEEARIGASNELWRRLAGLFGAAKDVSRAARCAQVLGDHELAAGFHEASYDWIRAAEAYRSAGNLHKSAQMLERALAYDKAAALYLEAGAHQEAADCYARAGAYYHAGHLYMKLGRYDQAVAVLQRVERMQQWFAESSALLGQFFEKSGNQPMAIAKYADVVRSRPLDEATVEIHHRLASLLTDAGKEEHAAALWSGVLRIRPDHPGARGGIKLLSDRGTLAPPPPPTPQLLVLPGDDTAAAEASEAMVKVHGDFDVLRTLPVFAELSLDELRGVHALCARVTFASGAALIEQGQPGQALYVLVSGSVKVEVLSEGRPPMEVARLGPGASLGEMAMVDSATASARVTAVEKVSAFRFPLDRLGSHLLNDPRAGYKVMKVLGRILSTRLREANRKASDRT